MRVEIDERSGCCFGVVRAISEAEKALGEGGHGLFAGRHRPQPRRGPAPRTAGAADRDPRRHAAPGGLPPLHPRPRRAADDLCRGAAAGHHAHRRHLPRRGAPAAPRQGGPRRHAGRRRSGGDSGQTGARRSGGPHGTGRRADDRHRGGRRPRADRLRAPDPLPRRPRRASPSSSGWVPR